MKYRQASTYLSTKQAKHYPLMLLTLAASQRMADSFILSKTLDTDGVEKSERRVKKRKTETLIGAPSPSVMMFWLREKARG